MSFNYIFFCHPFKFPHMLLDNMANYLYEDVNISFFSIINEMKNVFLSRFNFAPKNDFF